MTEAGMRRAYGVRADEYTNALGSIEQMHDDDRTLIERWSQRLPAGSVLDVGCGPGHWTAFLHDRGIDAQGLDVVPEFIDTARKRFPETAFHHGSLARIESPANSVGGVLAWYSMIHARPDELPSLLGECSRVLTPGGSLLIGFFEGIDAEPFPHAVTTAYYWSVQTISSMLDQSGLEIAQIDRRHDDGKRPHAAIVADVRRSPVGAV